MLPSQSMRIVDTSVSCEWHCDSVSLWSVTVSVTGDTGETYGTRHVWWAEIQLAEYSAEPAVPQSMNNWISTMLCMIKPYALSWFYESTGDSTVTHNVAQRVCADSTNANWLSSSQIKTWLIRDSDSRTTSVKHRHLEIWKTALTCVYVPNVSNRCENWWT